MKHLSVLLLGGVVLFVVLLVGVLNFFSGHEPPQSAIVIDIDQDIAPIKATLAQREATYQAQLDSLDKRLQEQQNVYQTTTESLTVQARTLQNQLDVLQTQQQNLQVEVTHLQATINERSAAHQNQLQQLRDQSAQRSLQLQTQLEETQTQLAKANERLQSP